MLNVLYMIFIYPVYMFVEFAFFLANNVTDDYIGFSIILLSITVNVICLPIYNVAEKWQEKERDIQKRLKPKIRDIKAVFKGDERYMMLSAYYRQNRYHPLYAMRGMFALLIQIPFFIAAYKLLSGLPMLNNASFWFLKDLGNPDGLLNIAGSNVNALPIVMTVINISASAVYSKGLDIKEKLQLYITAAVFLVLLYNSPSGLVFYWTLNNIFSLFKNIFYRIKLSKKIWYIIAVLFFVSLTVITKNSTSKLRPLVIMEFFTALILFVPVIWIVVPKFLLKNIRSVFNDDKERFSLFFQSAIALFMFLGLVIPTATIASSPQEFVNFENISNPFIILFYTTVQSIGCLFWLVCLYKLFQKKVQISFTFGSIIVLTVAILNAYLFQDKYVSINNLLMFSDSGKLRHTQYELIINLFAMGITSIIVFFILYSGIIKKYIGTVLKILLISFVAVTTVSSTTIYKEFRSMRSTVNAAPVSDKAYRISKTGKNIFIFMLDRSMNFFIDPIFESSELVKKEYTGFTVFENSVAFGLSTNFSTPSLFGGYEYTPEKIDARKDELLVDKHNEALSVLPRLFSEHNWCVSFTDPSWLNYSWIPDLSVFKKYNMRAKNIDGDGIYTHDLLEQTVHGSVPQSKIYGIRRNMLYFSLFKILPLEVRRIFYANGMYGGVGIPIYSAAFMNAYSALENITEEVEFVENTNCINIIVNNVTHEPPRRETLQMIGKNFLIPIAESYCLNETTESHFYSNYLAHESCAHFFSFLKKHGCWHNSRIILVGDHGGGGIRTNGMKFIDDFSASDSYFSPEALIPLIMMKDFDSDGALKKDYTFMTLADIPALTTKDFPPELQKNPFTGKKFLDTQDKAVIKAVSLGNWHANHQLKSTQFEVDSWTFIKDNVYDPANWSRTNFNEE
ncbi:YidC/Oxa1 family membrane protein insertase [Treponema denticola]|uniref:YidC/Oxa1 family membrane protein insertase n=1 Tax=Treponema denticola SP33 TaxID=999437 RepID=M2BK10_TREDN|nr:membrane protein insertase YidC [Treponema denticola]EMB21848.1 YidC/Oxa1 family membrane protein insertase [Treponema denticola SP33]EPF36031.1 YidC/Oxa1 family membrane protein insertase [Treponema denticola SP32]